jgi:hypothetical protein
MGDYNGKYGVKIETKTRNTDKFSFTRHRNDGVSIETKLTVTRIRNAFFKTVSSTLEQYLN